MDRPDHHSSCPCKLCVAFDCTLAEQEGGFHKDCWQLGALENYVQTQREKDLNWSPEPGHCLLCGGTTLNVNLTRDHYEKLRYNIQRVGDRFFVSLLVHKTGSQVAVYNDYLKRRHAFGPVALQGKDPKARLISWASYYLHYDPAYCFGIASKEHEEWIEIRLGYTRLVEKVLYERGNGTHILSGSEIQAGAV